MRKTEAMWNLPASMGKFAQIGALSAICLAMGGCATNKPVDTSASDARLGDILSSGAKDVVKAVQRLSEAEGGQRVVQADATQPAPAPVAQPKAAPSTAHGGPPVAVDTPEAATPAAPQAAPAPQMATTVIGGGGVIASGGLLSVPPPGLEKVLSIRWTGELEELLGNIAKETGWAVGSSTGTRISPVVINIVADKRTAFDIIRDIGAISGGNATVVLNAQTKIISVSYPLK